MDLSDQQVRRLLWEARVLFNDPRHPINDQRHPMHHQALAAMRLIEDQGKRFLNGQTQLFSRETVAGIDNPDLRQTV